MELKPEAPSPSRARASAAPAQCILRLAAFAEARLSPKAKRPKLKTVMPGLDGYPLGQGSGGTVSKVIMDGEPVAIKVCLPRKDSKPCSHYTLKREARYLQKVGQHPNIARLLGAGEYKTLESPGHCRYFLKFELAAGSLSSFLDDVTKQDAMLSYDDVHQIIYQGALALCAVKKAELVHCDVKPANILVYRILIDGQWVIQIRLADFGLAKTAGKYTRQQFGTISYMPPEVCINPADRLDEETFVTMKDLVTRQNFLTLYCYIMNGPSENNPDVDVMYPYDVYSFGLLFDELLTNRKTETLVMDLMPELRAASKCKVSLPVLEFGYHFKEGWLPYSDPIFDDENECQIAAPLLQLRREMTRRDPELRPTPEEVANRVERMMFDLGACRTPSGIIFSSSDARTLVAAQSPRAQLSVSPCRVTDAPAFVAAQSPRVPLSVSPCRVADASASAAIAKLPLAEAGAQVAMACAASCSEINNLAL